jgi:hypothetical protein
MKKYTYEMKGFKKIYDDFNKIYESYKNIYEGII